MTTPEGHPVFKVGDRVRFTHVGAERTGVIRSFQWQDWADEALAVIDLQPALKGAVGASMGIRIEQRRIIGKV